MSAETNEASIGIAMLRGVLCVGCALPLAASGCTLLGMGIGARADYKHNTIEPHEARDEIGRDVVVEVRDEDPFQASWEDRPAPTKSISGRLSDLSTTESEGSEWLLVCVQGEHDCVPGDQVDVVNRRDRTDAGFWTGTGVGAALDLTAAAIYFACWNGCLFENRFKTRW